MRQLQPRGKSGKVRSADIRLALTEQTLEKGRLEAIDLQAADFRQSDVGQIELEHGGFFGTHQESARLFVRSARCGRARRRSGVALHRSWQGIR